MPYELQKELKDAGFPQKPRYSLGDDIAIVNLSDLIEACGDQLDTLIHHTQSIENGIHDWSVNCYDKDLNFFGRTPEEAVARLWLELNKK